MSQSSPETMTREELEGEVSELREQVTDMQTDIAFLKKAVTTLTDADLGDEMGIMDLPGFAADTRKEIDDHGTAIESHGQQLAAVANVGTRKTDRDEKIAAIAAFATQKADEPDATVLVTPSEIKGCTDVTRRYSYKLVDNLGEDGEVEWASVREAKTVTTANGPRQKKKALKVDCAALRESSHNPSSVNQFNTRSHEGGA